MAKKQAEKVVDLMAALQASLRGADTVAAAVSAPLPAEEGGRAPECGGGNCQYAKDVGMAPEHRCVGGCYYAMNRPASVVGDASEGEAWTAQDEAHLSHLADCQDPAWMGEVAMRALAFIRSTRAALADAEALSAAMKREFTEYRDEQDTRLREAQRDARLARAALEEARKDVDRMSWLSKNSGAWLIDTHADMGLDSRLSDFREAVDDARRAIPSQESTTDG